EWEPHEATWIAWPHNKNDWPGKFAAIPWVYAEIVRHLHQSERVRILFNNVAQRRQAERKLRRAGVDLSRVDFYSFPTDRVWTRDWGPIFVGGNEHGQRQRALTHWLFRAWRKYGDWERDCRLPTLIGEALDLPVFKAIQSTNDGNRHIVLEGGAID